MKKFYSLQFCSFIYQVALARRQEKHMALAVGGRGAVPSWVFIHDTDIVDRGLIVLFFVFFSIFGLISVAPRKRLNSAIVWSFLLFFGIFFRCPELPTL